MNNNGVWAAIAHAAVPEGAKTITSPWACIFRSISLKINIIIFITARWGHVEVSNLDLTILVFWLKGFKRKQGFEQFYGNDIVVQYLGRSKDGVHISASCC
jgi:hypothetical protein